MAELTVQQLDIYWTSAEELMNFTTSAGTDTYDAGSVNIMYE